MKNCIENETAKLACHAVGVPARTLSSRPALLNWVGPDDLKALREALVRGHLPPDLSEKLERMVGGDLSQRFIEQNCRLFIALLRATEEGSFHGASPTERERLLRVLAYVRRDEDTIPDYRADGFTDDRQEILATIVELDGLIQKFKAWRLRHQVPGLWVNQEVHRLHA